MRDIERFIRWQPAGRASAACYRFTRSRSGSVAPLFAITIIVVFGIVGVAIDYGRATRLQKSMQVALDAGTLAAAAASSGSEQSSGEVVFRSNFADADGLDLVPTFAVQSDGSIEGTATGSLNTTISRVLGVQSIPIAVAARAGLGTGKSTTTTTPANNVCILLLDPTASQSLLVNGGANVNTNTCEVHVKSTASTAAVFNAGATLISARTCIESTTDLDNGGTHPNVKLNCRTAADPYAGKLPIPSVGSCTYTNLTVSSGTASLTPGVYCGWTNFNTGVNVTLAPGLYVIQGGGFNVDGGTWTGSGVTFYFPDNSHIQFNSGITSNMTAPTSGTYAGLLMFEATGLARSPFVFDDSKGSALNGLIYLPSRDMTFNSASKANGEPITMVFNTLILDQTTWNIDTAAKSIPAGAGTITTGTAPGELVLSR